MQTEPLNIYKENKILNNRILKAIEICKTIESLFLYRCYVNEERRRIAYLNLIVYVLRTRLVGRITH